MRARSKSRQFALALILLPALASAGEPAESVADISAHDAPGLEFFRGPLDFLKARAVVRTRDVQRQRSHLSHLS